MLHLEANSSSEFHTDCESSSEGDGRIGSRREASEAASASQMSQTHVEGIRAAPRRRLKDRPDGRRASHVRGGSYPGAESPRSTRSAKGVGGSPGPA